MTLAELEPTRGGTEADSLIAKSSSWAEGHLDMCELVIRIDRRNVGYIRYVDDEIIHYEKNFLKEAYNECKDKGLDPYFFTSMMDLERHPNGRVKYDHWEPSCVSDVIEALGYANQTLYFEGHYTWGPFFEWQWEPDDPADTGEGEEHGYMYILKKPYRKGRYS